ncbi:MAG: hypothetical protein ACRDI2_16270, partial [Chloroflexota bacterium]
FVDWGSRREVSLDELRSYQRGDPWLSAGLLKLGNPIYLVKWETTQPTPTLLHILSISDVELFGIDGGNYGTFVYDENAWEQRFGIETDGLTRGTLVPAVPPTATPTPAVTATPQVKLSARVIERKGVAREGTGQIDVATTIEITGALPNSRIMVSGDVEEWLCSPACTDSRRFQWGPREAGIADDQGRLEWTDTHPPYKGYTYIFEDELGNRVTVGVDDDLDII